MNGLKWMDESINTHRSSLNPVHHMQPSSNALGLAYAFCVLLSRHDRLHACHWLQAYILGYR
eukprot:370322-Hanusia_phi.AAC.1